LYTGLFAAGGAIIVAVSYILVAQVGTTGQQPSAAKGGAVPESILRRCTSQPPSSPLDKQRIAQCVQAASQHLGAQQQRDLTLSHLLQYSLITLAVVIALAAILGWIFSGRALRPVHQITEAARAASEHDLSARVALRGPRDELRELADTFDAMLARLQAAFEGQQRFIANASHELRTPLAVMRTTVDVVAGNPASTASELRGMAADIRAAVDHAEHLIAALLILARNERGLSVREQVDLATTVEDALDNASPGDRRVHLALEPALVEGDPVLAERLVANLINNAIRYNVAAGDIWISTCTKADVSRLTVANTGATIYPADVERIFEPFQRLSNRTSHDGYGLGLAIVASIAAIHGGTACARPRKEGGLIVSVTMPSAGLTVEESRIEEAEQPGAPLLG
jgi:signal transduction histidine kinase